MPVSRTRQFAKLPKDIDTDGNIIQTGLAAGVGGAGVEVYDSPGLLSSVGNTNGDQAYVQSNNRLYIWDSTGWYNVALINKTPTISSVTDANGGTTPFELATDGSTQTVITIVAQDSDGETLTYTVTKGGGFDSIATVSQDSSVFTITPFSSDSAGTAESGTLTFNVTDGNSIASTAAQTFTLEFTSVRWKNTLLSVGTSDTNSLQNNTYVDRSGNEGGLASRYGTGDVQTSFHPYADTWSSHIHTEAGALAYQDNNLILGTNDFTIEGWYFVTSDTIASGTYHAIFDTSTHTNYGQDANDYTRHIGFWLNSAYGLRIYTNGSAAGNTTETLNPDAWNHVAMVRSSGTITVYINGVSGVSFSDSNNYDLSGVAFGVAPYWTTTYTAGPFYLGDFRIEIGNARYTSGFSVPTAKFESTTDTKFLKTGRNDHKALINGSVQAPLHKDGINVSTFNPFGQKSEYSDTSNEGSVRFGTSDAISLETRPSGTTTTYTIEFWYKWDTSTTINANHYLFDSRGTPGGETGGALYLYRTGATTYNDASSVGLTDDNLNDGAWHYFAMCNDGTNLTYWLDGSRIKTSTTTKTIGTHLWLNSRQTNQYHNASNYADFRVSSTARYASTDTTITVPTSPLGYDTNTTAYYPFDNAGIYDKAANNTLTLAGDAATSTTQTKFANTSMYFDGTGDYAVADNTVNIFANDFTIEFWVNLSSTSSSTAVAVNTGSGINGIYILHGGFSVYATTNASSWNLFNNTSLASYMSTSQWHHVAVTWDGSTYRIFVDGTQRASASSTASISTTDYNVAIGATKSGAQPSTGYIENVQVLQYAKYTSNFTAPTQTQGKQYQAES